ncbi:class II aldolase/adducin family protein [Candidatus Poribacteria bacterium]|nr:class II aldolase/adducin family protein [Candidatus Poribacteria bacterium]
MKSEGEYRKDIVEVCRRIYNRGYVASNDGNVSVRISDDEVIATPTGMSKGFLTTDQLVKVNMEGEKLEGYLNPSSEIKFHIRVYRERPDVRAVVHAHPPISTAFAVAGIPLDELILPEVILTLGIVPIAPYAPPSTEELADKVGEYIRCCDAVLLANHGALTVGPDVYGAYYKMETLEHFAHILWIARSLGGPRQLSEEDVRRLMELRERLRISTKNPLCDQCPVLKAAQAFVDGIPLNVPAEESVSRISDEELIDKITKMVLKELERS